MEPTILDKSQHAGQGEVDITVIHEQPSAPTILDQSQIMGQGELEDAVYGSKSCQEPSPKRQKREHLVQQMMELAERAGSKPLVKWIATPCGEIPYVKNMDSGLVHCGFAKMKILYDNTTFPPGRGILCLSGCESKRHDTSAKMQCDCFCHILQKDYDSRH